MRCLYEVLGVERDVDELTLKAAYKKAAFRWHPDKNQNNLKEAEENFKELQNAYEVLSDKHERAWYDGHRNEILRQASRHQAGGGESFAKGEAPEEEIVLFPFFSSTCFNGYKDGPSGYYGVYEDLFARLDSQEVEADAAENQSSSSREAAPKFGSSHSEWAQISSFYSFWGAFSTAKIFAWSDKYNPAAAPNRKVRRLMEDENRKLRKAKRREFSETVRELVAFVKKRDKRVAAHQAEEAKRRQEREELERARREEERREKLQRAREFEEAAWAEAEAAESGSESAEEDIPDELYCLACDKLFRTPNAMANHNKSKKHLEKVSLLREVLAADDSLGPTLDPEAESADPLPKDNKEGNNMSQGTAKVHCVRTPLSAEEDSISDDTAPPAMPSETLQALEGTDQDSQSQRDSEDDAAEKSQGDASVSDRDHEDSPEFSEAGSEDEPEEQSDEMLAAMLGLHKQKEENSGSPLSGDATNGLDFRDEHAESPAQAGSEPEEAEAHDTDEARDVAECVGDLHLDGRDEGGAEMPTERQNQASKKSRRRRKDKAQVKKTIEPLQQDYSTVDSPQGNRRMVARGKAESDEAHEFNTCSVCSSSFTSRTKLFQHIRQSGHAALKL